MWPIGWLSVLTLFITFLLNQSLPITISSVYPEQSGILWNYENDNFMAIATLFSNTLIYDNFTCMVTSVVLLSSLLTIVVSLDYIKTIKINSFEYFLLILISTFSMTLIVSSFDLISMYLAIELQSLAFYVLAAYQRNSEFSTEAGLKYFILGALSSGLLLLGESLIYGFTGLTNFEELSKLYLTHTSPFGLDSQDTVAFTSGIALNQVNNPALAVSIGLIFILFAFLFKISAVPFHMWTPDVYEGAPTSVTAFFSIVPKMAMLALLLRICLYTFYDLMPTWQSLILICAVLSMFIGTFGALNQNKLKRLFAYSSIAHIGYILIGVGTGTIEAVESIMIYLIIYIITALNVFGILLSVSQAKAWGKINERSRRLSSAQSAKGPFHPSLETVISFIYRTDKDSIADQRSSRPGYLSYLNSSTPLNRDSRVNVNKSKSLTSFMSLREWSAPAIGHIKYMGDLSSFSRSNPLLALTFTVVLFSNAGVPPLAGFFGKLNIFLAAVESYMYFIALAAIVCSVIGSFYSIRLVKVLYFHRIKHKHWPMWKIIAKENSIVIALCFFFILFFFLSPSFLFLTTYAAGLGLLV